MILKRITRGKMRGWYWYKTNDTTAYYITSQHAKRIKAQHKATDKLEG